MKKISEIRNEASLLYSKSSHYIAGTFIAIGAIVSIAKAILQVVGIYVEFEYLILFAALFSPFELGMVKASLLAYEHQAKKVTTKTFTLMGLVDYFKVMVPFVGRSVIVYLVQALLVAACVYASSQTFNEFGICLGAVLTGNMSDIFVDRQIVILTGSMLGIILAIVIGFIVDAYFSLSYYYAVEHEKGLFASLSASVKSMKGHLLKFLLLKLSYLPYAFVAGIILNIISISLTTMFNQLISVMPAVPIIVFQIMLTTIVGFVGSFVSVMIYKVKEALAITIFYKEVEIKE